MVSYIFSVPQELEAAAAAAAESTARETAATTEAGASRTAWSGSENRSGLRRHGVEIVYEAVGEEGRAETAALIPVWRLSINILKRLAPIFFHPESHGERQKLFKHFRSLDGAVEAIGFDVCEKILETQNAFQSARATFRARGHEPAERADDCAA